jgi:nucleotide-binding universal stress UspA family protein
MKLDRIIHPSDFTHGDEAAFAHALRIALAARARFQLLHVKKPEDHVEWSHFPHIRTVLARWGLLGANATEHEVAELGLRVGKSLRASPDAVAAISTYIIEHQPDLLVLSTHQRSGIDRWLRDSIAEPVARHTAAATLFVPRMSPGFVDPESGAIGLRTVLIPIDRSPNPQLAVDAGLLLARTLQCPNVHFILLHIGPGEDRPSVSLSLEPGWTSEYQTWAGQTVDLILSTMRVAEPKIDLIVMATHGHHGFLDALRGSTTERVLHDATCPLLAVPARG